MNKKHFQVFLKIGAPNRKNLRKWNYGWSSRLKTCTTPTAGIFVSWLTTYQCKKIIKNFNSGGAGAHKVGKSS